MLSKSTLHARKVEMAPPSGLVAHLYRVRQHVAEKQAVVEELLRKERRETQRAVDGWPDVLPMLLLTVGEMPESSLHAHSGCEN